MILWSTAEAVLRQIPLLQKPIISDPMVYCGSGTETLTSCCIRIKKLILWSTAEAVLRLNNKAK